MNDKDREAFERWFYNYHFSPHYNKSGLEDAWQAACEYKDAQYRPRYEESEDAIYVNSRKF